MASNKPATLARFEKDKHIAAVKHLVDTMNWIISFCSELNGEKKKNGDDKLTIKVEGADKGKPVLKIEGDAGMKLKSGDDSNVVISKKKDSDGYYKIDVYYK